MTSSICALAVSFESRVPFSSCWRTYSATVPFSFSAFPAVRFPEGVTFLVLSSPSSSRIAVELLLRAAPRGAIVSCYRLLAAANCGASFCIAAEKSLPPKPHAGTEPPTFAIVTSIRTVQRLSALSRHKSVFWGKNWHAFRQPRTSHLWPVSTSQTPKLSIFDPSPAGTISVHRCTPETTGDDRRRPLANITEHQHQIDSCYHVVHLPSVLPWL